MLQKDRFAYAYLVKCEPKFEELAIMFAPYVDNVVLVSSDEQNVDPRNCIPGKKFVLVDEDVGTLVNIVGDDPGVGDTDYVIVDSDGAQTQEGGMVNHMAVVPYVGPDQALPLQMMPPLDMIDISSTSTQSSIFNWWEHISIQCPTMMVRRQ